jgi:MoxR-like ATPase
MSSNPLEQVLFEVKRTIVGQDLLLERMAIALLSGGHLLVEGVPGLAKTLAVKVLAESIGGQFQRVQFTPDLVPADLTGTRVYRPHTGDFETILGPVFANLLLADEINRAPAKVQSALLEVMQERQVTIGRETFPVPNPFLVMATQNPIESEGTYPLPEAQVDRFMMKVLVDYPTPPEEHAVVGRALQPPPATQHIITPEALLRMQAEVGRVYVDPSIVTYAVNLVGATRAPAGVGLGELTGYLTYGGSPRASINLVLGARAMAFLRGRDYVLPSDIADLAPDVLRHRLVLSYQALADNIVPDTIIAAVLRATPAPEVATRPDTPGVGNYRSADSAWQPPAPPNVPGG